jgi:hypothetical protein
MKQKLIDTAFAILCGLLGCAFLLHSLGALWE